MLTLLFYQLFPIDLQCALCSYNNNNNIFAKSARTVAQHINYADRQMLSQTARQAIVWRQLQPLSACLIKLLAEGSSKVTESGVEPAIFRSQG